MFLIKKTFFYIKIKNYKFDGKRHLLFFYTITAAIAHQQQPPVNCPVKPDWYRIVVRKVMVLGEPLYEGRMAELPGVVVYGTTKDAVRAETRYHLNWLHAMTCRRENHAAVAW